MDAFRVIRIHNRDGFQLFIALSPLVLRGRAGQYQLTSSSDVLFERAGVLHSRLSARFQCEIEISPCNTLLMIESAVPSILDVLRYIPLLSVRPLCGCGTVTINALMRLSVCGLKNLLEIVSC